MSERFSKYEENLGQNLMSLLTRLQEGGVSEVLSEGIGKPLIFPKRLNISVEPSSFSSSRGHAFFSDSKRAFKRATFQSMTPEFRLIGDFSVDCHVISALWVNLVGHKYDARLSPRSLASRVRRYRPMKERDEIGHYHLEALGSFEPYFAPYRKWRDDGIKAMEHSVAKGESIVALTLDVGNFYHSIDPDFFVNPSFLREIGLDLSRFETEFSSKFSSALKEWSNNCASMLLSFGCKGAGSHVGGIPIGLSIVRIISNSILSYLDDKIEDGLSPIYYARYVDDLFW